MPLAVLQAGKNPLWFELAEAGPRQIGFPGEAELAPFMPWPLARHIRFILPRENDLVIGVNRDGFLRGAPWGSAGPAAGKSGGAENRRGLALYRTGDAAYWGQYTLAAVFPYEGQAAALLYRDDFFAEPLSPPPAPRVFVLSPDSPELHAPVVPAFEEFPAEEGWDLDTLFFAPAGHWYYRAVLKNTGRPEIRYRRTGDLSRKGEAVSLSGFQNSALPEPYTAAPVLLRTALEAAFALEAGSSATVVSPAFPGPRWFSGSGSGSTETAGPEIAGFYREPGADCPGIALAILPDGRGFFCAGGGGGEAAADAVDAAEASKLQSLSLPALPPGFAYTAAALCGNTLIAAWEEQDGYRIGAAGFMAIIFL
jgi:hypothetical protein